MKNYPPGKHDDQVDASKLAFDSIINRHLFLTRLAYRVPFFILEVFLIALFTIAVPVGAGWVLVAGMEIIQPGYPYLVRLLGYWLLGAVTIGGAGITIIGVAALWSALKDSAVRLLKLIRDREK